MSKKSESNDKPKIPNIDFNRLVKPDFLGNCPHLGTFPVWIAPGDVSVLDDTKAILNKNLDFSVYHHQQYCLTKDQFQDLWGCGLCRDTDQKTPLVNYITGGRLACMIGKQEGNLVATGSIVHTVDAGTTYELKQGDGSIDTD